MLSILFKVLNFSSGWSFYSTAAGIIIMARKSLLAILLLLALNKGMWFRF